MSKQEAVTRKDYKQFYPITTRWMDNDIYGHVNNVTYYSYFDTVVNQYLIEEAGMDIQNAPIVGFVVHSSCSYVAGIAYPQAIEAGIHVKKLGNSSVTYGVGIFKKGADIAAAYGEFVHVFVERAKNKSVPIPGNIRAALEKIMIEQI